MKKIITTDAILVITDYNFIPNKIEESWIVNYTENYLIYDKAHRLTESNRVKHQPNVGANIYDIFDYIVNNYDNLPNTMIFCKGNVVPRHCGLDKFNSIINNTKFTTIENYIREAPRYRPNIYAYVDDYDCYYEKPIEVNATVSSIHISKYIGSYQQLIDDIFYDGIVGEYIRFAPGGNHILTKCDVLKYNKYFYESMRNLVSWDVKPGEAYLLERAFYTIYNNNFKIKEKYINL